MHLFAPPRSRAATRAHNFLAFDTETEPDGGFICAALHGEVKTRGKKPEILQIDAYFENQDDLINYFSDLDRDYRFMLVGHNVDYDLIYLRTAIDSNTKLYTSSRLISAKTAAGNQCIDTMNFVDGSLSTWIEKLDMTTNHNIHKRVGYLNSAEGKREQVKDDAKATFLLMSWIQEFFLEKFGVTLRNTRFATALEIFKRNYFTGYWYRSDAEEWKNQYERGAYYGGRVEVFRRGEYTVQSYDINSMYVDIMTHEHIPNPTKTQWFTSPQQIGQRIARGDLGVVDVTVSVPDQAIGPLPFRRDGKLIFPVGRWRARYTSVELRAAMEYGVKAVHYHSGLFYTESAPYFREYAQMTLEGRRAAREAGDAAMESLFKFLGNGIYGKFAQRNAEGGNYVLLSQFQGDIEGKRIIWIDASHAYVEIPRGDAVDALHTFPVVSAFVSAYARVKLLHALNANKNRVVYCDTDSIKILTGNEPQGIEVGSNPGQWKHEYTKRQVFYAPKCYGDRRKGVPKKARLISAENGKERYKFETPTKYRSAVRQHTYQNVWREIEKTLSMVDDKRIWGGDGNSHPHRIDDKCIYAQE